MPFTPSPPSPPHDHENEVAPFAQTNFRGRAQRFGVKTDDRRRHMYLVGKTGMGKTSMLEQLVHHDILAGHGVAYLDPHGDTAQKLLDFIPPSRINDVIYFNPADLDWPVAFNVLEHVDRNQQHLVASGLIGIFKKIWADSWGPRLEYVLRNAILALMDYPGTTLLGIMRILVDKEYRRKVIAMVQDPVVKSFWVDEYARYPDKFQTEAIAPIQNKVGQFLSSPLIRNIVGQVKSTVRIPDIMDNGKILIMNLAKGGVGEDNSALLGAMMVTKIYLAAMERVRIPEHERRDFYLYVDEFQNFATDSFADILSEARKYRLNLTLAHQYIGQLMTDTSTRVRDAVYGNVGTIITFRVGAQDAEFLEPEFMPVLTQEDLVNLPKWQVYLKLMINGITSDPFSAGTLPPIEVQHERQESEEKVVRVSRERYAVPRAEIEEKIAKWTGMAPGGDDDEETPPSAEWGAARDQAREITRDLPRGGGAVPRPSGPSPSTGGGAARSAKPEGRSEGGGSVRQRPGDAGPRRGGAPISPPPPRTVLPFASARGGVRGGGAKRMGRERGGGADVGSARSAPSPSAKASEGEGGGWYRQALRAGGPAGGGMATERSKPEPRTVECASCGGGATVFFTPRPGQRILCENCIRADKERRKVEEIERQAKERRTQNAARRAGDGSPRAPTPGVGDRRGEILSPPAPEVGDRRGGVQSPPAARQAATPGSRRDGHEGQRGPPSDRGPRSPQQDRPTPPAVDEGTPIERTPSGPALSLGDLYAKSQEDRVPETEDDDGDVSAQPENT